MNRSAQLAFNVVLALALGFLYYLHFSSARPAPAAAPIARPAVVAADPATADSASPEEVTSVIPPIPAGGSVDSAAVRRIAYVESVKLLEGYKGALAARRQLEAKLKRLEQQHQGAVAAFQTAVQQYQARAASMLDGQRREQEEKLAQQEQQVAQQQQQLQQQAAEEEAKLNEQVLGKVNKLLERYGKEQGYDLILIAGGGNVAYGRPGLDITPQVLRLLNAEYGK